MDKYILLFLFCYVTSVDSLPFNENDNIKLKTLIAESPCNFPPMFLAKDEEYASQFRACSADQSNNVLKQMCFELEKESMCYLTPKSASSQGPVVLPTSNITRSLFSGKDKQDYVTQLCQYMTTLPWKSDECSKECSGDAFFICDLYVAMDKVLRSFFEQEAQDYTHLDVFVHSGELGFLYPYPPIGALHNKDLLMDCATPSQDTGLIQLCKVMAEVAVKFVKNRVKATFHARQVTENVTAVWDPCSSMSTFAAFSTSQEFTQLQQDCPQLCNASMGICKLIYLGIETYQNLAGGTESQSNPEIKSTDTGNVGGNQNANGSTGGQTNGIGYGPQATGTHTEGISGEKKVTEQVLDSGTDNSEQGKVPEPDTKTNINDNGGTVTGIDAGGHPLGGPGGQPQIPSNNNAEQNLGPSHTSETGTGTDAGGHPLGGPGGQPPIPNADTDLSAVQSVTKTTYAPTMSSTDESYSYNEDNTLEDNNAPKQNNEVVENKKPEQSKHKEVASMGHAVDEDESSGGHFMAYFLVFIVLSIAGYIVFHNKQKIFAIIIEGKSGKGGRRPNTKDYKQLKTDDVMPSLEKSAYSKDYVF